MIVSVLFLIGLFLCISAYLILTGLNFIGLSYLLVYVGAVLNRINIFAALVKIQLYKVLLDRWYNSIKLYLKKSTNFVALLNLNYIKTKLSSTAVSYTPLQQTKRGDIKHTGKRPILWARGYSTVNYKNSLCNTDFYEWFCGFVDGEGYFRIRKDSRREKSPYAFEFTIHLHLDDKHVLDYIQTRLNLGNVISNDKFCRFSVYSKTEIEQIIGIFNEYPLNTSKKLNFEDWRKAFEFYNSKDINDRGNILTVVEGLRNGMNNARQYEIFKSDNIKITKYWLLGFIEAEGSFSFNKDGSASYFVLGQVSRDRFVLEKIVEFLKSYSESSYIRESLSIYDKANENLINQSPYSEIRITNLYFLRKVLVPLLRDLNWRSKKHKDFKDWTLVLDLKYAGLHTTSEGKQLILKIASQMNNNRLSTNKSDVNIDVDKLHDEIQLLLAKSTDHISKANPVNLYLENGELVMSFPSVYSCAQFLGINKYRVTQSLTLNKTFNVEDKVYYVRKL